MRGSPLSTALEQQGALVLDGAMATELERRGADLSGALWSARVLTDHPEMVQQVHRDYFAAGADVCITASYQASVAGFGAQAIGRVDAERLIRSSVDLARAARDDFWASLTAQGRSPTRTRPVVATSVGPYGAVLADGSEYRGDYDIAHADLVRFHRERLQVLVGAGVEVLAVETIPSLTEARAVVEAMSAWPELSAWVSFSARCSDQVSDGGLVSEAAAWLDIQEQVVAVGVNCTAVQHISPLVAAVRSGTDKPVVVYPNSGETWDGARRVWVGHGVAADFGALAQQWYAEGARLIGGCCRTGPDDIRAVSDAIRPLASRNV